MCIASLCTWSGSQNGHKSHQKCSMLHFATASFDPIGVVRIASTQCPGEHGYPYEQRTNLWSHGVEGREERSSHRIVLDQCSVGLTRWRMNNNDKNPSDEIVDRTGWLERLKGKNWIHDHEGISQPEAQILVVTVTVPWCASCPVKRFQLPSSF